MDVVVARCPRTGSHRRWPGNVETAVRPTATCTSATTLSVLLWFVFQSTPYNLALPGVNLGVVPQSTVRTTSTLADPNSHP